MKIELKPFVFYQFEFESTLKIFNLETLFFNLKNNMGLQWAILGSRQSFFLESCNCYGRSTRLQRQGLCNCGVGAIIWVIWMERNDIIFMIMTTIGLFVGESLIFRVVLGVNFKRVKRQL